MSDGMKGKVCVVTGGASGLGRATALALARQGAVVAIGDQQHQDGRLVVDEIERLGGSAAYIPLNVTDSLDVQKFIETTVDRFGRLDCESTTPASREAKAHWMAMPMTSGKRVMM